MVQKRESIMVATLGGQPQVVTFALDALLAKGENIREVIVLYLSSEGSRVNRALTRLSAEFIGDQYFDRPCRLRPMPIRDGLARLEDIANNDQAIATQEMVQDLIIGLKKEHYPLHICVSGGRRMMALLITSVAILNFGYRDRLWHLYTPDAFLARALDGAIMHAHPEDGVELLEVPLVPLGTQFPALQGLLKPTTAPDGYSHSRPLSPIDQAKCDAVIAQLTPRELETLKGFAAGLSPQSVADEMGITLNTLNTYRKKLFDLCRNEWPSRTELRYFHLRDWFGPYFNL